MATFTTDRPNVLDRVPELVGLTGDSALIGIEFRVQNGLMYGVGNNGGIYTIKTPPVAVEYSPTALGASLRGPFAHLYDWTVAYASESQERRRNHRQRCLR